MVSITIKRDVMRSIPAALQIAAENFPPGDVACSKSGELSKDGHRPSKRDRRATHHLEHYVLCRQVAS